MVTKQLSTSSVYGTKDILEVRISPLRVITHGWVDCIESFRDWQRLRPWKFWLWGQPLEDHKQIEQKTLFNLLGQPLADADDYNTPWDDYLLFGGDAIWVGG